MKTMMGALVILTLLVGLIAAPVQAAGPVSPVTSDNANSLQEDHPPGEWMIVDAAVVRPIGVISFLGGVALTCTVMLPWTLISNDGQAVTDRLIKEPFQFTFERPLGQFNE
ncbi:MAG: hypothetical protein ACLGPL_00310 [Acidobacteriota bacterium]